MSVNSIPALCSIVTFLSWCCSSPWYSTFIVLSPFLWFQNFLPWFVVNLLCSTCFSVFLFASWCCLTLLVELALCAALIDIIYASTALTPVTYCRYRLPLSFLMRVLLIFFLCKGSPSVIRQVPVVDSLSLLKFSSSLPHFLLYGHVLKKMGYSTKFACYSLPLHDCSLLALLCT